MECSTLFRSTENRDLHPKAESACRGPFRARLYSMEATLWGLGRGNVTCAWSQCARAMWGLGVPRLWMDSCGQHNCTHDGGSDTPFLLYVFLIMCIE